MKGKQGVNNGTLRKNPKPIRMVELEERNQQKDQERIMRSREKTRKRQ